MQGKDTEIKEKKIKEMEQNEQTICYLHNHKYKIHISNQDLITQKEKTKSLFQLTINMARQFFAEEEKMKKS